MVHQPGTGITSTDGVHVQVGGYCIVIFEKSPTPPLASLPQRHRIYLYHFYNTSGRKTNYEIEQNSYCRPSLSYLFETRVCVLISQVCVYVRVFTFVERIMIICGGSNVIVHKVAIEETVLAVQST